jgi:acetyltransferase
MNSTLESEQAVQEPDGYPSDWIEEVQLQDGTSVLIRPIRPDDAPRLQDGYSRLSADTIYYRFLDSARYLTDEQALRLSTLDYQRQMALVAAIQEAGEARLIGVARYSLIGDSDPGAAETAIVVRDDYQGKGLGTLLYDRLLRYARQHGVRTLVGTVLQSNARIMHFIRKSGLAYERDLIEPGVLQVRVFL